MINLKSNVITILQKLVGKVEVGESYFGAKRARGTPTNKQLVFGISKRGWGGAHGNVPNLKQKTLRAIILGKVDFESVIHADGWCDYNGLVSVG